MVPISSKNLLGTLVKLLFDQPWHERMEARRRDVVVLCFATKLGIYQSPMRIMEVYALKSSLQDEAATDAFNTFRSLVILAQNNAAGTTLPIKCFKLYKMKVADKGRNAEVC